MRRPISSLNPVFYFVIVKLRRFWRYLEWLPKYRHFAKTFSQDQLKYRVYKHQSVLVRKLGDSDLTMQYNKVENLKIAIDKLNGIIIKPGETFSFCYLVGCATRRKGYLDGMLLLNGEARAGVGGGLCHFDIKFTLKRVFAFFYYCVIMRPTYFCHQWWEIWFLYFSH